MRQRIDISDVFLLLGLVLIGTGLFFWFGLGPALTATGGILLFLGLLQWWAQVPKTGARKR